MDGAEMTSLAEHQSATTVKLLLFGNSGVGKTGALGTLAAAGYRLFVFDFDNGLDILLDPKVLAPEFRKNVYYKLLQDKPAVAGNALVPQATAWKAFTSSLSNWKEGTESMGGFNTWGEKDVIVIDSITLLSDAAFTEALAIGGRLGQRPQIQDYGAAVENIQAVFELLYSSHCKANVVVTSHLAIAADDFSGGANKALASVLGKKLGPKLPRYFNNVVCIEKYGIGAGIGRRMQTAGTALVDLKVSKPSVVPPTMEPDLAKLFALLKGESVPAAPAQQKKA
jgi:hypothetical protein